MWAQWTGNLQENQPGHLVIGSGILSLRDGGVELGRGELGGTPQPSLLGEPSVSSREETCTIVADRPGAVSQRVQASLYSVENGGGGGEICITTQQPL